MNELERYVNRLFRGQDKTAEMQDLKEEILSNMQAQKADLVTQGMSEKEAIRQVKNSLTSLDGVVEDLQLTWVDRYHTDCVQLMLISNLLYWILSLPTQMVSMVKSWQSLWLGMGMTLIFAVIYLMQKVMHKDRAELRSVQECRRKVRLVWFFWALTLVVILLTWAGTYWGSDIWFHRPLHVPEITGPWTLAVTLVPFYLLALSVLVPVTVAQFPRLLQKQRKEENNVENE